MEVAKSKTTKRRKSGGQGEIDEVYEVEMSQPKDEVSPISRRLNQSRRLMRDFSIRR